MEDNKRKTTKHNKYSDECERDYPFRSNVYSKLMGAHQRNAKRRLDMLNYFLSLIHVFHAKKKSYEYLYNVRMWDFA